MRLGLFGLLTVLVLSGCVSMQEPADAGRYFASPQKAIPEITRLLKAKDFETLAACYDLSGSTVRRADLESGTFFVREKPPAVAHPAGFWRYKHPFAPGFQYSSIAPGPKANVHKIQVRISIDQGEGAPPQIGFQSFYMIKSAKGWQILPDKVK